MENKEILRQEMQEEKGAAMVEYGLLLALIAVVCILAITFLGDSTSEAFSQVGSSISQATN